MEHFQKITEILFKTSCENSETMPHSDGYLVLENLKKYLEQFEVEAVLQEYNQSYKDISRKHANLIIKNKVNNEKYIGLQGHIDTIPCNKEYVIKITETEIIGRGAVDMKGPLVGLICAFIELVQNKKQNVVLIITDDEETDFAGIERLINEKDKYLPDIQYCINAEPTKLQPAYLTRGFGQYEISSNGNTGHSSSGENDFLIERMRSVFNAVCDYLSAARKITDPVYGETRAAFTMLNSGIKTNQLPSDFYIACNMRIVTNIEVYKELFNKIVLPKIDETIFIKELYFEPFKSLINESTILKLNKAFDVAGIPYNESIMHAFTESYMFNKAGIPCFSWGPGSMDLAHVVPDDEKILISEIKLYSKIIILFIETE